MLDTRNNFVATISVSYIFETAHFIRHEFVCRMLVRNAEFHRWKKREAIVFVCVQPEFYNLSWWSRLEHKYLCALRSKISVLKPMLWDEHTTPAKPARWCMRKTPIWSLTCGPCLCPPGIFYEELTLKAVWWWLLCQETIFLRADVQNK